ncbi:LysR family transcriptional regulator [Pseudorhodobacter sp. E13]|uniref:LysR substrate-binding domain-containing protein n=1 Tax=Pseudorhodobacter sp. E13 TaxID=2487931 RepID=UPI000F8F65A5|nr:LysR substrate-binding domain-containing protein [Pseudorhodobacter sp. E13]RUS59069.1 LysR family transcriptional regulator [Pseudorhodobacter sp. E13]
MAARIWHSLPEYQALRAVMESGTTSAAAARLGLSQSAVSRSISSLEARIGQILFERDAGRLVATREAVQLNHRLDPLFEALNRLSGPPERARETLRLIAPPTYAHRFLTTHIASFIQTNPHAYISLEVAQSDEVIRGIVENRFDLGLTGVELSRDGIRLTPYRTSSAVCVLPKGHALAQQSVIRPQDLHDQPLIALTHRHARRAQLDTIFQAVAAVPIVLAEVATSFAAVDMVSAGLGLTVVNPFPIYSYRSKDLAFRAFDSDLTYRSYFVASDARPQSATARAFMRHLRLHTPIDPFSEKA